MYACVRVCVCVFGFDTVSSSKPHLCGACVCAWVRVYACVRVCVRVFLGLILYPLPNHHLCLCVCVCSCVCSCVCACVLVFVLVRVLVCVCVGMCVLVCFDTVSSSKPSPVCVCLCA